VTYILLAASILIGLFLFGPGTLFYDDPTIQRYLEYSLRVYRQA
jgi:hypothetical protein